MAVSTKAALTIRVTTDIIDGKEKHLFSHFLVIDLTVYCYYRTPSPRQWYWLPWHHPLLDFPSILLVDDYYHLLTSLLSAISVLCCTLFLEELIYAHNFTQQLFCLCLQNGLLTHWYFWALARYIPLPSRFDQETCPGPALLASEWVILPNWHLVSKLFGSHLHPSNQYTSINNNDDNVIPLLYLLFDLSSYSWTIGSP